MGCIKFSYMIVVVLYKIFISVKDGAARQATPLNLVYVDMDQLMPTQPLLAGTLPIAGWFPPRNERRGAVGDKSEGEGYVLLCTEQRQSSSLSSINWS
jgi:hypothetical protein